MTDNRSTLARFTTVAGNIGAVLSRVDLDMLDRTQLVLIGTIKRLVADARLDIRDWEMAETRQEMQRHGREAQARLEQIREAILLASQHDIFRPIEVGEISAQFDHFELELKQAN